MVPRVSQSSRLFSLSSVFVIERTHICIATAVFRQYKPIKMMRFVIAQVCITHMTNAVPKNVIVIAMQMFSRSKNLLLNTLLSHEPFEGTCRRLSPPQTICSRLKPPRRLGSRRFLFRQYLRANCRVVGSSSRLILPTRMSCS